MPNTFTAYHRIVYYPEYLIVQMFVTDPYSSTYFNIEHKSQDGNPIKIQEGTLNIFELEFSLKNNKVPNNELACGSKHEYATCIENLVQNLMKKEVKLNKLN
jgi:hypothetical protein